MRAKLFDPFSEDAINEWLALSPVKEIHSAHLFDRIVDGQPQQVALVFYEEEQEMGCDPSAASAPELSPLAALLNPIFHPELEPERVPAGLRRTRGGRPLDRN